MTVLAWSDSDDLAAGVFTDARSVAAGDIVGTMDLPAGLAQLALADLVYVVKSADDTRAEESTARIALLAESFVPGWPRPPANWGLVAFPILFAVTMPT